MLKEYDVLELYGQTFSNDHETYYAQIMRQFRKMDMQTVPSKSFHSNGHELIPLGNVKDAQPMYVVAVCRKKRRRDVPDVPVNPMNTSGNSKRDQPQSSFYKLGTNSFIANGHEIVGAEAISIGDNVLIKKDCWLNIAINNYQGEPRIIIDDGCQIGKNFTISVSNKAIIEKNVIVGPNVYIADCGHVYEDIHTPIMYQGVTSTTNEVSIGEGSWLGINSVVVGNVRIGKGCVVAANTFVNKDVPDYSVVAGNPAKIIKMFDLDKGDWVRVKGEKDVNDILKKREVNNSVK